MKFGGPPKGGFLTPRTPPPAWIRPWTRFNLPVLAEFHELVEDIGQEVEVELEACAVSEGHNHAKHHEDIVQVIGKPVLEGKRKGLYLNSTIHKAAY